MNENRIKELEKIIKEAQDEYYNGENVTLSDEIFDKYWNELTKLDPSNPILHKIGEDSGSAFKKVKHKMHMFSQEKAINPDEFLDWVKKQSHNNWIVEYKCDGSSIELQYENGVFKRAITRGNGEIGDDVTDNIIKASGVVKTLKDSSFSGGVRGEVLLMHDTFNKYFKDKANCRNAANGIMKRKNSEDADKLSIVVYDACNDDKSKNFIYEEEKLDWLKDQGFDVVYHESAALDPKYIISLRDRLSTDRFEEIPYDIDGLVIKDNIVDLKDCERDRPTKQIAFKFILNEAQTTVRGIDFSVAGKTRTPVAICDPVYLCGTTVTRANLCNLGLIKESNLRIGSKVIMVKRGEIIPKIERVIETPSDCKEVNFPTFCEFCGSPLTITDTTIFCPNLQCPETQKHRITTWAKVNKIYGLGPQIVSLLYDRKLVTRIFDLYTSNANVESLSTVISPKIATKLVDQINKTRELSLAKFIAGFDLDGIGETTVINICQVIPQIYDLDTILAMKVSHLAEAPGFGYKAATNIVSELQTHKDELIELSTAVKIKTKKMPDYSSDKKGVPHLYDCVLAFTGPLFTMSREEAVEKVRECGGRVVSNVTPLVNYVVTNETESSNKKFVTAKKLGIQIINEEEFKHLLEGTF